MRIAYVSADRGVDVAGTSGSSIHVRAMAEALQRRGHEVTLYTPRRDPSPLALPVVDLAADPTLHELRERIQREARATDSHAARAAEVYSLLLNQTLRLALEERRPTIDVVYERQSLWSIAGLQFARQADIPFVLEVNAPLCEQQERYRALDDVITARACEHWLLEGADGVVATSEALVETARTGGASRRAIRVIPCGVDEALLARGRTRTPSDTFVVGFVGSLKPWHGLEILLDVFLQLAFRSSHYRLLIVGDGPMLEPAREFCRQHGLLEYTTFTGSVAHDEVGEWLARMDVGVAPYPPIEPFYFSPLKLWEYAAAGVPIVASASGELPQLFPHREAALLHPPGNIAKIVRHIERLRANPELGTRLARRARRVAREHTWDRLAARLEAFLSTCIAQRAGGADT